MNDPNASTEYAPPEEPEVGNFEILFRDEHYVAVAKPSGIAVHRGSDWDPKRRYVLQMLRRQIDQYLFPVHRLDRATSGVLLFGLSKEAARGVMDRWSEPSTEKEYLAVTRGSTPDRFWSTRPLTAKRRREKVLQDARSDFETIARFSRLSIVSVRISTGRRHQIRRHLSSMGHHIVGDTTYGKGRINDTLRKAFDLPRLGLHARRLRFEHPFTDETVELHCPLAEDLRAFLLRVPDCPQELLQSL